MDLGYEVIFTISGMVLVFLILVLLMVIIKLEGRIFEAVGGKKAEKPAAAPAASAPAAPAAAPAPAAKPAAVQPAAAPAAVQVEAGIPGDVVAAIMAAITAMSGGSYTLRAVSRGANNWSRAGVLDATSPF